MASEQVWDHRVTIGHLLDLADLLTRSDLRAEVIRELERLAGILTAMQSAPEVDRQRLQDVLDRLDAEVDRLHALPLPFAQRLMESDMIGQLRKRHNLALGNCDFDQPAYRWWLARSSAARQRDLDAWAGPFMSLGTATTLILGLIRQTATAASEAAQKGFFSVRSTPRRRISCCASCCLWARSITPRSAPGVTASRFASCGTRMSASRCRRTRMFRFAWPAAACDGRLPDLWKNPLRCRSTTRTGRFAASAANWRTWAVG